MPSSFRVGTSGSDLGPLLAGDGKDAHLAGLVVLQGFGCRIHHQRNLPADQVLRRGCAAAVGHVRQRHAGGLAEQQAGEMRHRAGTRGRIVGLGRIGLHPGQHRLEVAGWRARAGSDREVEGGDARNRGEVLDRVVAQVGIEPGWITNAPLGERISVWPSGAARLTSFKRHPAAGAGLVVHDHVLVEGHAQLLGQQACDHVGRAARRKAHQDLGGAILRQHVGRVTAAAARAANWRRFMESPGKTRNLTAKLTGPSLRAHRVAPGESESPRRLRHVGIRYKP